jgi:hypothetical protein
MRGIGRGDIIGSHPTFLLRDQRTAKRGYGVCERARGRQGKGLLAHHSLGFPSLSSQGINAQESAHGGLEPEINVTRLPTIGAKSGDEVGTRPRAWPGRERERSSMRNAKEEGEMAV